MNVKKEGTYTVNVSELGTNNIDLLRVAVKDGEGNHIGYSNTGAITLNYVSGAVRNVYVFDNTPTDKGNVIDYAAFEGCSKRIGTEPTWHREDHDDFVVDNAVIKGAMDTFNSLLAYGTFSEVASGGTRGVGYGYCAGNAGMASRTWFGVNPNSAGSANIVNTFLAEAAETYAGFDDVSNLG